VREEMSDPQTLPFLIVGGGIGGLAAALALARKGFPCHVLEQSPSFGEVGAGIQLGPNVFRAFEKLGIKDAVLRDAWKPNALVMRDALNGETITTVPVGADFRAHFGEPYAVTHRADLHRAVLVAAGAQDGVTLETNAKVEEFVDEGTQVRLTLAGGRSVVGRALIGADGLWSKVRAHVVGDGTPIVSGHIAYRAVLPREDVPKDLWSDDVVLWAGPKTHLVHYPLRRGELYNLVAVFHSDKYVEGALCRRAAGGAAPARPDRDLAHVGVVRPRAGGKLDKGQHHPARRCRAPDAAIFGPGRLHGHRGFGAVGRRSGGDPG